MFENIPNSNALIGGVILLVAALLFFLFRVIRNRMSGGSPNQTSVHFVSTNGKRSFLLSGKRPDLNTADRKIEKQTGLEG